MSRGKQASFLSRRRGGQHLHLPFDREGLGVAVGLAGELHVGATDVPVVVIANDGHLRRVWREEPTAEHSVIEQGVGRVQRSHFFSVPASPALSLSLSLFSPSLSSTETAVPDPRPTGSQRTDGSGVLSNWW